MYLGIDLGGTNLKAGVVDDDGNIVYQFTHATRANKGLDYVLNNLKQLIYKFLDKNKDVKSIGVGIPGIIDEDGTVKISPNLPEWVDVPLGKFLKNIFPLPTVVDNDANVAALAELEFGAAQDVDSFLYVTLGTGAGGAIVINKKIYRGEGLAAGEFGHMIIDYKAPLDEEANYRTGIVEKFVGRNHITAFGREFIKDYPDSLLHKYDRPDPYFISEALSKGDEAAKELFTIVGTNLGIGLASALNLLDIGTVVIGGGISQAHPHLLDTAEKVLKQRTLPPIAERAEIRKAKFTKDAGIIGAAMLGKRKL
jgi:glucokinase